MGIIKIQLILYVQCAVVNVRHALHTLYAYHVIQEHFYNHNNVLHNVMKGTMVIQLIINVLNVNHLA